MGSTLERVKEGIGMHQNSKMTEYIFRPISDIKRFPLLASGHEEPCMTLMACANLVFFAANDFGLESAIKQKLGREWHQYGDSRWPSPAAWIEFPLSFGRISGDCGVLAMNADVPVGVEDPLDWCANNTPLTLIHTHERSEEVIRKRLQMMRAQAVSTGDVAGPEDERVASVQCYCIFHREKEDEPQFIASYTDLLNADGVPIPRYRMADAQSEDIPLCRLALHALFCMNESRLAGAGFIEIPQLKVFGPTSLPAEQSNPKWAQFHPLRVMRTRPMLKNNLATEETQKGLLTQEEFEHVAEIERCEAQSQMLAFEREARPRSMALYQSYADTGLAAFVHRAVGGAIYVLPDRLVEEFDNTDCSEVLVLDIKLPFTHLFLKFTPPRPLLLGEDAFVDGCYVVRQADEYLFTLTSCRKGVDYPKSLSIASIDPTFSLHLPANNPETNITAAVESGIQGFLAENMAPEDDLSRTIEQPDGTQTTIVDIRAKSRRQRIELFRSQEPVFRACLNIIVNAACFIAFRPDDITEEWEGEPPAEWVTAASDSGMTRRKRDKRQDALKRIQTGDFTRIRVCGKNLFAERQNDGVIGGGVSPRAHWRRGHWRRQRHGAGLTLVSLRWIRPTIVKRDSGPLVEARLYELDGQQGNPGQTAVKPLEGSDS